MFIRILAKKFICICFGIVLLFTVPFYPNLIDLALSASTLFVNYINTEDYIMGTKKTNTFGIWGEMGERSSVKVNIMSVKINDFPLPPIQRATVVALLFFYILCLRDFFCCWVTVACIWLVFSGSFTCLRPLRKPTSLQLRPSTFKLRGI